MSKPTTAVKSRYNAKVYDVISFRIPKEMSAAFRAHCTKRGIPQAQVLKLAITDFINEEEGPK